MMLRMDREQGEGGEDKEREIRASKGRAGQRVGLASIGRARAGRVRQGHEE